MHILVTNDDGIEAPGLLALAQAVQPFGKVTILAPDRNWSISGHSKTLHRPLQVTPVPLLAGVAAYKTDGAPSDCVAMVLLGLLQEPVDLVVSGVNPFANLGHDMTYSGTVTAAMEAVIGGLPAVAFSLDGPSESPLPVDYSTAAWAAAQVTGRVITNGLPPNTLLNVNIPYLPQKEIHGFHITRLGMRIYHDQLLRFEDPPGQPYYKIGGKPPTGVQEQGTDIGSLAEGYISITPLHLDFTAHHLMEDLRGWDWPGQA